mmetsp:Transcript_24505/g.69853  ORF Transcript_24505/g.69853 Transcript_24505/m.69853 type:complete len:765 (-) Transcript_24505:23-2317(-)
MSLFMEPPHHVYASTHNIYDADGEPSILQESTTTNRSILLRGQRVEENDDLPLDSNVSVLSTVRFLPADASSGAEEPRLGGLRRGTSFHSIYTMHSAIMSDGILNCFRVERDIDDNESSVLGQLPARYDDHSIKSKATWFGALCLAGVGMFVEALVIITTGQIKTIWHAQYPECWDAEKDQHCPNLIQCCDLFPNTPIDVVNGEMVCAANFDPPDFCQSDQTYPEAVLCGPGVTGGVSYSEFAGIMAGMLIFGIICDKIGRNKAGTITSMFMIVGISGMTLFNSEDQSTLFILFSVFFSVFGMGVGGEYPLTASGAAEYHVKTTEDALLDDQPQHRRRVFLEAAQNVRRGETISLVFAMQGAGAVIGSILLVVLIYVAGQSRIDCDAAGNNSAGANPDALAAIWRSFYLIGLLCVVMLLLYRWLILEEDTDHSAVLKRQQRREAKLGREALSKWRILNFYSFRLIGTGGNWFVWDIAFYGLKLYSGPIFAAINPEGDLVVQNGWLLFNNLCALAGYYCAARVIDIPTIGRKRLQMASFTLCAILFSVTGAIFSQARPGFLMVLFFASSFFGNFGANVTTYVMAAETYPTELRATCHGISAFMGKCGALFATIAFAHLQTDEIFFTCAATSIMGILLTAMFSVDLTRVPLSEHDAQLELFLEGRLEVYKGKLNAPQHLSLFERLVGRHGEYDPKWASKLVEAEKNRIDTERGSRQSLAPHSFDHSPSRHKRRRTLSSKSGKAVFPVVEEDRDDTVPDIVATSSSS